ncbi:hypothetical protein KFK09_028760 [Dendrobium nobile]|uniref:Uncharacterized protein n=1 Tax=Dendrobium nobile TaxID=94219 RepID=A0A8T3A3Y5_DENNO|nr:hypothetical protein KFK09_028760 [Dendrobium nobile]
MKCGPLMFLRRLYFFAELFLSIFFWGSIYKNTILHGCQKEGSENTLDFTESHQVRFHCNFKRARISMVCFFKSILSVCSFYKAKKGRPVLTLFVKRVSS